MNKSRSPKYRKSLVNRFLQYRNKLGTDSVRERATEYARSLVKQNPSKEFNKEVDDLVKIKYPQLKKNRRIRIIKSAYKVNA